MWTSVFLCLIWLAEISSHYHPRDNTVSFSPLSLTQITNDTKGKANPDEHNVNFWYAASAAAVRARLGTRVREGVARNVILFLGDGMSPTTVTAARIYLGQLANRSGEEQQLCFDRFPYTGLSKTYCVDSQVADSACSGTAYLCGVKTNVRTIGVTADVRYGDWRAMQDARYHTASVARWAQAAGKGTGIVTTCKVTDASPTATYAHVASRWWQTDQDILHDAPNASGVQDITRQLVENDTGRNFKVIMGGGRETFLPKDRQDEYGYNGTRGDGLDLIQAWRAAKDASKVNASYVTSRDQLLAVDVSKTDYLLGLFHHYHMDYHLLANATLQPTLAEMTSVAITMMQKEKNGYFLFIEGGRIDHGHHENKAHLALDEVVEFHKAIEVALAMTSEEDTLVVVTADYAHTLTMSGYPARGSDILTSVALAMTSEEDTLVVVTADHAHTLTMSGYPARGSDILTTLQATGDNMAYSTLSYANGPGYNSSLGRNETRHNIAADDRGLANYTFPATFYLPGETHGGEDVAVYARGPWAHLLAGVFEQTVIPHVISFAAKIGPSANITASNSTSGAPGLGSSTYLSLALTAGAVLSLV